MAIPYGIILLELVSNSLKQGFVDGRKGEIHIGLHVQTVGRYILKAGE